MLAPKQEEALLAVQNGHNAYIGGPAGCGKSFLIQKIVDWGQAVRKSVALTCSTGIACSNFPSTTTEYGKQERGTRTHSTTRIAKLKQQIKSAIDGSRYITALNHINRIGTGKSTLQKFVKLQVRCQARRYVQEETQMSAPVSQKTIQNFSWRRITEEIEAKMPLLHASLAGAVTRWNNEQLFLELTDAKSGCAIPVIGMATAMLLHRRNQQKVHFLQDICSLEMWSSGSGQKAQMKTEFLEQPSYTAVPYNQQTLLAYPVGLREAIRCTGSKPEIPEKVRGVGNCPQRNQYKTGQDGLWLENRQRV